MGNKMAFDRVVAHCANPFLPVTTVWMYDQIRTLKRYTPIVLTQLRENLDQFPFEPVYSAEDFSTLHHFSYRAICKLRGTYVGYHKWLKDTGARLMHAHFGQEGFRCLDAAKGADISMVTTFYGMDVSALPRQKVWQKRYRRLFAEGTLASSSNCRACSRVTKRGDRS